MRVEQRVHFDIASEVITAAEVAESLGFAPDRISVRASRVVDPPRPALHRWSVECRRPGLRVDDQIREVVRRLAPVADRIGEFVQELLDEGQGWSVLQVARFFDYPDGEDDTGDYGVEGGSGQHQLLGWHLDVEVLEFLRVTRAELDVDEYG